MTGDLQRAESLILEERKSGAKEIIQDVLTPSEVVQEPGGRICLISREGTFLRCMAERPLLFTPYEGFEQIDRLTWSADSQKVYFVSEVEQTTRLIEASAADGTTLRVLYEAPYYEDGGELIPVSFTWTPDLHYVLTNAGHRDRSVHQFPQLLIDLQTHSQIDLGATLRAQRSALGELQRICLQW